MVKSWINNYSLDHITSSFVNLLVQMSIFWLLYTENRKLLHHRQWIKYLWKLGRFDRWSCWRTTKVEEFRGIYHRCMGWYLHCRGRRPRQLKINEEWMKMKNIFEKFNISTYKLIRSWRKKWWIRFNYLVSTNSKGLRLQPD